MKYIVFAFVEFRSLSRMLSSQGQTEHLQITKLKINKVFFFTLFITTYKMVSLTIMTSAQFKC